MKIKHLVHVTLLLFVGAGAVGCGTQHIRLEDNPTGFDDLVYMLESTLKIYDFKEEQGDQFEAYRFAPFSLIYTGPMDCELNIKATLEIFEENSSTETRPMKGYAFVLQDALTQAEARREARSNEGLVQQMQVEQHGFSPKLGDGLTRVSLLSTTESTGIAFDGSDGNRTKRFYLITKKDEGLKIGHWYRLTLDATREACSQNDVANLEDVVASSTVEYDFYVSQSITAVSFGVGTALVVGFTLLGL